MTRPRVLIPALIGFGLLIGEVSFFWGVGLLMFAAYRFTKLMSHGDLDDRLRLKADKERHGIRRMLTSGERHEVILVDRYCQSLEKSGADTTLTADVRDQAWEIVKEAGPHEATATLKLFRQKLPTVASQEEDAPQSLPDRIARELRIVHATQKEMESLG